MDRETRQTSNRSKKFKSRVYPAYKVPGRPSWYPKTSAWVCDFNQPGEKINPDEVWFFCSRHRALVFRELVEWNGIDKKTAQVQVGE
jgi:hypothetical protein